VSAGAPVTRPRDGPEQRGSRLALGRIPIKQPASWYLFGGLSLGRQPRVPQCKDPHDTVDGSDPIDGWMEPHDPDHAEWRTESERANSFDKGVREYVREYTPLSLAIP